MPETVIQQIKKIFALMELTFHLERDKKQNKSVL